MRRHGLARAPPTSNTGGNRRSVFGSGGGAAVSFPPWRRDFGCSRSSVRLMELMFGHRLERELPGRNVHRWRGFLVDAFSGLVLILPSTRHLLGAQGKAVC
jgi:hypothetical protein